MRTRYAVCLLVHRHTRQRRVSVAHGHLRPRPTSYAYLRGAIRVGNITRRAEIHLL